jgi:hypothetical protein
VTILTLRRIREDRFEVTGPDIEPVTFKPEWRRGTGALRITRARQSARLAAARGAHRRQWWLRPNWLKFWSAALT